MPQGLFPAQRCNLSDFFYNIISNFFSHKPHFCEMRRRNVLIKVKICRTNFLIILGVIARKK